MVEVASDFHQHLETRNEEELETEVTTDHDCFKQNYNTVDCSESIREP